MNRVLARLLTILFAFVGTVGHADSRIEMLDGSTVNGDVVSYSNGRYVIETKSLGTLEIDESTIRSIVPGGVAKLQNDYGAQIQSFQRQISASPALLGAIMDLQADPNLQAALQDPNFMHLIMSGDLEALKNSPRFLVVLDNPAIQEIVRAVQARR